MSATPVRKNPFPGLRPFTPEEDYLFFGREEQTLALLQRLGSNRFVAVVGTSGSGKSSLVRCGLLSELLGGGMLEAGAAWQIAVTHPGGNPLALLANALLDADLYDREVEHSRENLLATLSRSHFGLVEAVKQADLPAGTNFLLVVDQFEEIFRFQDAGQKQQEIANEFVSLLLEAVSQKEVPIYVVLTMRSDFIGECSQFEGLAEMVNRGEFLIPRLTREQYKRVIEGPIKVAGGQIAPRLLQRLLNDLGQQADQLPCLQHALMRTWDLWAGKGDAEALDLDDYQRVGKMSQALSLHADEVFESLASDRQRELCRGMFEALTVEESNSRGIRRPQRLSHLCQILEVEADELRPIIDAYRRSGVTFLMPSPQVELTPPTIIDISHESLMRVWTRLRQWVEEETQAAGIYHRLAESAELNARGQAGLYRDPELGIALAWQETKRPNAAWAERYRPGFEKAIGFLEASQQAGVADEQAREAARQRELEQAHQLIEAQRQRAVLEQRAAQRLRVLTAGMALVAVLAVGASVMAVTFWRAADTARGLAERSERAAQNSAADAQREAKRAATQEQLAKEVRDEAEIRAYTASLAAAAADLQRNDSRTLRRRLEAAPERLRGWEWTYLWNESDRSLPSTVALPHPAGSYRMDLSADSKLVAVRPLGGNEQPITVYDTQTGAQVVSLKTYSSSMPMMTFSADNKLLAYHHHGTPGVQLYNVATGLPLIPKPHDFRAFLGFDLPGERMALLTDQYKIRIFKTADFSQIAELPGKIGIDDFRRRGAISADGKLLVVGAFRDDPMRIFDLTSNKLLKEIADADAAIALQFDDTGSTVTTVSSTGVIAEYAAPEWKKTLQTQEARQGRGGLAVYRLDKQLLRLSFDSSGAVALFDSRLTRSATLHGHGAPGESIAVDKQQDQIVTAHRDGSLRRWDLRHPQKLRLETQSVAFTPDGKAAYASLTAHSNAGQQLGAVDPVTGRLQGFLHWFPWSISHGSLASQVAYSPDGQRVAVATSSGWGQGRWRIFDLSTGLSDHEAQFPKHGDLECIGWSADGHWIAVGGRVRYQGAGLACLYNASTHERLAELDGGAGGVHALAFNPNSRQLATASADGVLRLWEVPGGKLLSSIGKAGDRDVNCVIYSSDGRYLVAGFADGTVAAWNSSSGEQIFRSQVHGAGVKCLAFTPDGSRLMTAAADQSLKVFDPAAWRELLTLYLEDSAGGMSFSPDGKRLALAAGSLMWLETEAETDRAKQRQLAREPNQPASLLLTEIFDKAENLVQAREQILARTSSDAALRRVCLRNLLNYEAFDAYQGGKLNGQVALELLRQQVLLDKGGRATAAQQQQMLAGINARSALYPLQRQALVEYATAVTNWQIESGTTEQAWEMVADRARSADDQLIAYFGLEPQKRKGPPSPKLLKALAAAEYRAALYADALETAQKGLALSTEDKPVSAQLLAVLAMAQYRSGQTAQALETLKQLDNLLQDSTAKADKIAVALSQEARTTLAAPLDQPWDEQAAIATCQERMKKLQLDEAKVAAWAAHSAARRFLAKGELDQAAAAFGSALSLANDRAAKANLVADAARLPGVLEKLIKLHPDDVQLQLALARSLTARGAQSLTEKDAPGGIARLQEARDIYSRLLPPVADWTVLAPLEMATGAGLKLELQNDGSFFVHEPKGNDTYSLVFQTDLKGIKGLRLEALTDARLPSGGPGWAANFVLNELTLEASAAANPDQPRPIALRNAMADFSQVTSGGFDIRGAVDGNIATGWAVWPEVSSHHTAVFETAEALGDGQATRLTVKLNHQSTFDKHLLGRFRLSFTNDAATLRNTQIQSALADYEILDLTLALAKAYVQQDETDLAIGAFADANKLAVDRAGKVRIIAEAAVLNGVLEKLAEQTANDALFQTELARHYGAQGSASLANAARRQARALLEQQLAQQPENAALAAELADLLLIGTGPWTILKAGELTSQGGETMTVESDGSIFVSGPIPDRAVYTLTFPTEMRALALLRLETICDARLPAGGAGRTSQGNFHLAEVTAAIESTQADAKPTQIEFTQAISDDLNSPQASLDRNPETIWDTWPRHLQPHSAVFAVKTRVPLESGTLKITIDSGAMHGGKHGLGRFRLSSCEDPTLFGQEQKRFAAMKSADPWKKLGAAYARIGDFEQAGDQFAKSAQLNGNAALLEGELLNDQVFDVLRDRHQQFYASLLPSAASAAAGRGQIEQARGLYDRLAKLQPEQPQWKERLEQLQPNVLAAWNFDTDLGGWGDATNCDASINDGILTVRTTAADPHISTRTSAASGAKAVVLRYRSDEPFTLQVFWAEGSEGFSDSHHWDYPIPAAAGEWAEIALPFWCQGDLTALRLDPDTVGDHPMAIDSLLLRSVQPGEYQRAVSKLVTEPELTRLAQDIAANPMSAPAYASRAAYLARLGRWREAADDFEQERRLAEPNRINFFKVANCRLLAGDIAGHQQLCREMITQFREASDANIADSVCKTCLLSTSELKLSKLPVALLREAVSDPQQKDNQHWFVACCALASYREGNDEQVIGWTKDMPTLTAQAGALALVVRAMAEQRLGQVDQARETLAQAETVIPSELRSLGSESYGGPLPVSPGSIAHDWLAPEILRREAAKLIRGKAASQP